MALPDISDRRPIPQDIRVQLAHAAAASLAAHASISALILKGPAMDASVSPPGRASSDVDVLVAPDELGPWLSLLVEHGWRPIDRFETGSSFEHSQTFHHDVWGHLDVHRRVPGIGADPAVAFRQLWDRRTEAVVAGCAIPVPEPAAQALILCLHAARSFGSPRAAQDLAFAWTSATPARQSEILAWVTALDAQLGWAAVTGHLDDFRDDPAYRLWVVASRGGTRLEEWRARIAVAPSASAKLRTAARAVLVNTDSLAINLGRQPTTPEVLAALGRRARIALWETVSGLVQRLRGEGRG